MIGIGVLRFSFIGATLSHTVYDRQVPGGRRLARTELTLSVSEHTGSVQVLLQGEGAMIDPIWNAAFRRAWMSTTTRVIGLLRTDSAAFGDEWS